MPSTHLHPFKPPTQRCYRLLRLMNRYLDKDVPAAVRAEVESHVRRCKTCRCVKDTLKKTIALYRSLPEIVLPRTTRHHLDRLLERKAGIGKM